MSIRGKLEAARGGARTSRFSKNVEAEAQYPITVEEAFKPKEVKPKKLKAVKPKKEKAIKPTKK